MNTKSKTFRFRGEFKCRFVSPKSAHEIRIAGRTSHLERYGIFLGDSFTSVYNSEYHSIDSVHLGVVPKGLKGKGTVSEEGDSRTRFRYRVAGYACHSVWKSTFVRSTIMICEEDGTRLWRVYIPATCKIVGQSLHESRVDQVEHGHLTQTKSESFELPRVFTATEAVSKILDGLQSNERRAVIDILQRQAIDR